MLPSRVATFVDVRLTAAEYLAWERTQPGKHELLDGEVLARPVESPRHYALCVGTIIALNGALRGRRYTGLMADRPIVSREWRDHEIVAGVPASAESIEYGLALVGEGRAWLDAVSLELIPE